MKARQAEPPQRTPLYTGLLKVGYTTRDVRQRVAEHIVRELFQEYPTLKPGEPPYRILLEESVMHNDGACFTNHDVHQLLHKKKVGRVGNG